MAQIVESVPNFSEGRNSQVIDKVAASLKQGKGVRLLDLSSDERHNRSVATLVGPPEGVLDALEAGVGEAMASIDLNRHEGEHPRMGAMDVVPLIPLQGCTLDDCVRWARELGERLAQRYQLPIYLYAAAAAHPQRAVLSGVRGKGFEELRSRIASDPPDFGPPAVHPTAGATAVGARGALIAYNVNLWCSDLAVAQSIARRVRHSSGGLRYVQALGLKTSDPNVVQVSMNLTDHSKTSLYTAYTVVRTLAAQHGVGVKESELVGMLPLEAVLDLAREAVGLRDPLDRQVLEVRLWQEE
jgi:glutamate formiminotransferase